jgi:aerobic carbon-monoxide dehydrogenase small subunit
MSAVTLRVNSATRTEEIPDGERLLDTLRWRFGLKGTKEGCRTGACGACAVLVNGRSHLSCLLLTAELDGESLTTVEGLSELETGRRVLAAFEQEAGLQCGYCTPGFVVECTSLLEEHRAPTSEQMETALEGHLCRCTGYASIRRAVASVTGGRK